MQKNNFEETKAMIFKDLEIEHQETYSNGEDEFLSLISERVLELLSGDSDLLFSYLYRLDIDENKIDFMLNHQLSIPPHQGIARLIYDRQLKRLETKKKFKQDTIEGWEW